MKNLTKAFTLFFSMILWSQTLLAQGSETDFFRNTGKIYVVVAIIVATFLGIVFYLIYLDRKIARLERESED